MKELAILVAAGLAVAILILILSNHNECEKGSHPMGAGICMSNMEKM